MTEPFAPDLKRAHERLTRYWEYMRADRSFPSEGDIDPESISDLWPSCFLIDVSKGGTQNDLRYEYMGPELLEAYGADMTGVNADAPNTPHIASMLSKIDSVIESGRPAMDESVFRNARGIEIRYRCCLLPLGSGPGHVEYILGCMRWKFI